MTMSIRGNAPDLIAGALYHLGYRPHESLVVLGLRAETHGRATVALTARVDLPDDGHVESAAEDLAGLLSRSGAGLLVVVLFTELSRGRARNLGGRFRSAFGAAGLHVLEEYQVVGEHYRGLECRDRSCCPNPGHPLGEVLSSPGAATCVAAGLALVESAEALIADVRPEADTGPADPAGDGTGPAQEASAQGTSGQEVLSRWLTALEEPGSRLPDGFAEALLDVRLRDAVLLSLCGGSGEDAMRHLTDPTGTDAMHGFMTGRPDQVWHAHATTLLAGAARVAGSTDGRVEVLAVLAWLAWWQGAGARSRLLLTEVLDRRPAHRLGGLLQAALTAGTPPPWSVRSPAGVDRPVKRWCAGPALSYDP